MIRKTNKTFNLKIYEQAFHHKIFASFYCIKIMKQTLIIKLADILSIESPNSQFDG